METRKQKETALNELYDRIWKTKSARFNAAHRLNRKYLLSSYATSLLSVYIILLSLLQPFELIKNSNEILLINFLSVCISILLLVFVLMESSMQYNLKAEKFHDCAKKLSKLFKKIELLRESLDKPEDKDRKMRLISNNYDKTIELYDNHDPIDYKYFLYKEKSDKLSRFQKFIVPIRYIFLTHLMYYFAIFIVPIILFMVLMFF